MSLPDKTELSDLLRNLLLLLYSCFLFFFLPFLGLFSLLFPVCAGENKNGSHRNSARGENR